VSVIGQTVRSLIKPKFFKILKGWWRTGRNGLIYAELPENSLRTVNL
jgi:hypothetical protein